MRTEATVLLLKVEVDFKLPEHCEEKKKLYSSKRVVTAGDFLKSN